MLKRVVRFGLLLGIFLCGLSLFIEAERLLLQKAGLALLAISIAVKIPIILRRWRILGASMVIVGFLIAFLAISSSDYRALSDDESNMLWLVGLAGTIICLIGMPLAFSEANLRRIERRHADWHRIEHPHGYR